MSESAITEEQSRGSLRALGVSPETVACLSADEAILLDATVERFVAYGYGRASQRRFLATPHPRLGGRTAAESLAEPDGPEAVLAVIRSQLDALEKSR